MVIKKQFKTLRTQVKEHLSTSRIDEENGAVAIPAAASGAKGKKGKRKAPGPGPVFVEVRKWVLDHGIKHFILFKGGIGFILFIHFSRSKN
jgi:hypothetical protein